MRHAPPARCSLVPSTAGWRLGLYPAFFTVLLAACAPFREPGSEPPADYKVADVIPGAISRSGRWLSYTDFSTGDLALMDLETGEKRHLTHKGSWQNSPDFAEAVQTISMDGTQVAYAWHLEGTCDLRTIALSGGEPRIIYRNDEIRCITPQEWSPDGRHVLATFLDKEGVGQTVLVSVADGSLQVLPTADSSSMNMRFSPDGRWVAYDYRPREGSSERDIEVVAVDGGRAFSLVENPADDFVMGWSRDGKHVVFGSDRGGISAAWVASVRSGKPFGPPRVLREHIAPVQNSWVGFSRNGSYYYGRAAWEGHVYLATLDPLTGTLRNPHLVVRQAGRDTLADWSPDGRFLAYVTGSGNGQDSFTVAIRSTETGSERRFSLATKLSRIGGHAFHPRWSPDGRFLLVQGRSRSGDAFSRVDAASGEVTQILRTNEGVYLEWPVWSSDGNAIFYRRSEAPYGVQRLVVYDPERGDEQELYRGNFFRPGANKSSAAAPQRSGAFPTHGGYQGASNLAVSPDGRWLAFVWSEWSGGSMVSASLRVVPTAPHGNSHEIFRAETAERILQPAWMPEGDHLLFGRGRMENQAPKFELWSVAAEGGAPRNLGFAMDGQVLYGLSVHPDGRRVALVVGRDLGTQTWVMDELLP